MRAGKRKPRKPTGEIGAIRVSRALGVPKFEPVPFPTTKEAVECYVARPFVRAATYHGFFPFAVLGEPELNATDDLDFTLQTSEGKRYLELMTIDLRNTIETGGSYQMDVAAQSILDGIQSKSRRYRGATPHGIILLTYVTHWQFALAEPVLFFLSYWLFKEPPIFEQVYYMSFQDASSVSVSRLYPTIEFKHFDPAMFRGRRALNLNPHLWQQFNE